MEWKCSMPEEMVKWNVERMVDMTGSTGIPDSSILHITNPPFFFSQDFFLYFLHQTSLRLAFTKGEAVRPVKTSN